jgi:hypothetical protein
VIRNWKAPAATPAARPAISVFLMAGKAGSVARVMDGFVDEIHVEGRSALN